MDSYTAARRYTTGRSVLPRRHTRIPQQGGLRRLLAFQTLVSFILLLIIIIAKNVRIAPADFITGNVRYVLEHNVELNSIYTFAKTTVLDIKNSILPDTEKNIGTGMTAETDDYLKKADKDLHVIEGNNTDQADQKNQTDRIGNNDALPNELQLPEASPGTSVLAASSGAIDAYTTNEPGAFGMISPAIGSVATPFGEIEGPGGLVRMHKGIDISVDRISEVKAALDGIVADSGSAPGYGNFIKLIHDNGLTTIYGNCSSIAVKINDPVKKGYVIAGIGEDSMTGGHLHFEVWQENDPVDPLDYITVTAG